MARATNTTLYVTNAFRTALLTKYPILEKQKDLFAAVEYILYLKYATHLTEESYGVPVILRYIMAKIEGKAYNNKYCMTKMLDRLKKLFTMHVDTRDAKGTNEYRTVRVLSIFELPGELDMLLVIGRRDPEAKLVSLIGRTVGRCGTNVPHLDKAAWTRLKRIMDDILPGPTKSKREMRREMRDMLRGVLLVDLLQLATSVLNWHGLYVHGLVKDNILRAYEYICSNMAGPQRQNNLVHLRKLANDQRVVYEQAERCDRMFQVGGGLLGVSKEVRDILFRGQDCYSIDVHASCVCLFASLSYPEQVEMYREGEKAHRGQEHLYLFLLHVLKNKPSPRAKDPKLASNNIWARLEAIIWGAELYLKMPLDKFLLHLAEMKRMITSIINGRNIYQARLALDDIHRRVIKPLGDRELPDAPTYRRTFLNADFVQYLFDLVGRYRRRAHREWQESHPGKKISEKEVVWTRIFEKEAQAMMPAIIGTAFQQDCIIMAHIHDGMVVKPTKKGDVEAVQRMADKIAEKHPLFDSLDYVEEDIRSTFDMPQIRRSLVKMEPIG